MSARTDVEVSPDLSQSSVEGLIWLLRHPALWDEAIEWDYSHVDRCAIGVHRLFWGRDTPIRFYSSLIFEYLDLHYGRERITPAIVAKHLAEKFCVNR